MYKIAAIMLITFAISIPVTTVRADLKIDALAENIAISSIKLRGFSKWRQSHPKCLVYSMKFIPDKSSLIIVHENSEYCEKMK